MKEPYRIKKSNSKQVYYFTPGYIWKECKVEVENRYAKHTFEKLPKTIM